MFIITKFDLRNPGTRKLSFGWSGFNGFQPKSKVNTEKVLHMQMK